MGAEKESRLGCGGAQGTGVRLVPDPLREAPTAERAAPPLSSQLPQGSPGPALDTMGRRAARTGLGPAAERERETGNRRRGRDRGRGGPAAARAGGEARGRGARLPRRRPNKDARGTPAQTCRAGWAPEQEEVAGSLLGAAGRRHHGGGGSPGPPHAGKSSLPTAARVTGPAQPRQPRGPALAPQEAAAALGSPRRRGRAGTRQRRKLGSGLFRFTGLAARPSARAHEWPDERGPAAPVRPAGRCARRVPPRASARAEPLGLSFLLPPARSRSLD